MPASVRLGQSSGRAFSRRSLAWPAHLDGAAPGARPPVPPSCHALRARPGALAIRATSSGFGAARAAGAGWASSGSTSTSATAFCSAAPGVVYPPLDGLAGMFFPPAQEDAAVDLDDLDVDQLIDLPLAHEELRLARHRGKSRRPGCALTFTSSSASLSPQRRKRYSTRSTG